MSTSDLINQNLDDYDPLPELQDPPPVPLIARLRARHVALAQERMQQQIEADRRDYGFAVVLGELETWIAQIEQAQQAEAERQAAERQQAAPSNGAELAEQLGAQAEQDAPSNGAERPGRGRPVIDRRAPAPE